MLYQYFLICTKLHAMLFSVYSVGMNYQKLSNVTDLGLVYIRLNHINNNDLHETLKSTKNKCIWGKKLLKYGFTFKGITVLIVYVIIKARNCMHITKNFNILLQNTLIFS